MFSRIFTLSSPVNFAEPGIVRFLDNHAVVTATNLCKATKQVDILTEAVAARRTSTIAFRVIRLGERRARLLGATFLSPLLARNSAPVLEFKEHYVGPTHYLDWLPQVDITHAVMWGIDCYLRPYLCAWYVHKCEQPGREKAKRYKFVCFQRYTGSPEMWCRVGSGPQPILGEDSQQRVLSKATKRVLLGNLRFLLRDGCLLRGPGVIRD